VTPFLYRRPERFTKADLTQSRDESRLRWTVDTPADFEFVRRVYEALYPANPAFSSDDVRALPFSHREPGV
jgi:spore coat polysaccharide biosynthesis protein SpsF